MLERAGCEFLTHQFNGLSVEEYSLSVCVGGRERWRAVYSAYRVKFFQGGLATYRLLNAVTTTRLTVSFSALTHTNIICIYSAHCGTAPTCPKYATLMSTAKDLHG